jgi:DegV family protein with EDD domain
MGRELALEEHPEKKICVIDSRATAGAMVLLIRKTQQLIEENPEIDFEELCETLQQYQTTLRTCFTLECFDNLIKNGRMRPLVGTLLHTLGIHVTADATPEGTIRVLDKVRGEAKTYKTLTALMKKRKDCQDAEVVICHCENLDGAEKMKEQILKDLPVKKVDILNCRGLTSFYAMEKGLIIGY